MSRINPGPYPTVGGVPRDTAKYLKTLQDNVDSLVREHNKGETNDTSSTMSASSKNASLQSQLAQMPVTATGYDGRSGWGLTAGGWVTVASAAVPVIPGKNFVQLVAIGAAAALDMTSGGVTSLLGNIQIAGVSSPYNFPSAKDAGASVVNNVMYPNASLGLALASLPLGTTSLSATFLIQALNPTAFPANGQNFASMTLLATFSNDRRYPPVSF